MNNYLEYFTNYIKTNYDLKNDLIIKKFYHSLRVAFLMEFLAKKLHLSEEDINLAFKLGLCHDLGRFYEVVKNGKFNNQIFDHAAYSIKMLYNDLFVSYMNIQENILFRKAIYWHNKKDLSISMQNRELLFANLLRDADKLDLLAIRSQGEKLRFNSCLTNVVVQNYLNNQTIDICNINTDSDRIILYLSFIKDLVFDLSFALAIKDDYLNNLMNIIEIDDNERQFTKIVNKIKEREKRIC